MKKILFFALMCVFLISACVPVEAVLSDEEALQIRNDRILNALIELEQNPDLWMVAPQRCLKGMVRILLFNEDSTELYGGSASLIQAEKMTDLNGDVAWIYRLITADHVVRDFDGGLLGGDIVLVPGDNVDQNFWFTYWDYTQFKDENGVIQDLGMVTVVGVGELSKIIDDQLSPLEITNVVPFDDSSYGWQFFSFDYPEVTDKPQFSESEFGGEVFLSTDTDNVRQVMKPLENSSTVTSGSSGGAICSKDGQHLGVVTSDVGSWPLNYIMEGNPLNITEQINEAIQKSLTLLKEIGFVFE